MIRRVSPEYIVMVVRLSMVSEPLGSTTSSDVPSVVPFLTMTHQPAPSVAAAVRVWVKAAVASMTLPASAAARIVFEERLTWLTGW